MDENDIVSDEMQLHHMKATLTFLEDHIQRGYKDIDTLDNKARANIGAVSLLLSFVTAFQLLGTDKAIPAGYWISLGIILLMYMFMVIISLRVIAPEEYKWPVNAEWEDVSYYWGLPSEKAYLEQITSDYIEAITHNQKVAKRKVNNLRIGGVLFGLIIIGLGVGALTRISGLNAVNFLMPR
jgi:hypothetical protein